MDENDRFWRRLTEPETDTAQDFTLDGRSLDDFGRWLRQPREDVSADERELSARITERIRQRNAAAQAEMDRYLHGNPRKAGQA
jgi:hypothetical protein